MIRFARTLTHLPLAQMQKPPIRRRDELIKYLIYVSAFTCGLYCNMKSLQLSNVETVWEFLLAPAPYSWSRAHDMNKRPMALRTGSLARVRLTTDSGAHAW